MSDIAFFHPLTFNSPKELTPLQSQALANAKIDNSEIKNAVLASAQNCETPFTTQIEQMRHDLFYVYKLTEAAYELHDSAGQAGDDYTPEMLLHMDLCGEDELTASLVGCLDESLFALLDNCDKRMNLKKCTQSLDNIGEDLCNIEGAMEEYHATCKENPHYTENAIPETIDPSWSREEALHYESRALVQLAERYLQQLSKRYDLFREDLLLEQKHQNGKGSGPQRDTGPSR